MTFFDEYTKLFEKVEKSVLLLTPNQRLSRFVKSQYDSWQRNQKHRAWETIRVLSFSLWINNLYRDMSITGDASQAILKSHQEAVLWRIAAGASMEEGELMSVDSMAELASRANRNLKEWKLDIADMDVNTPEMEFLQRCILHYEEYCTRLHVADGVGIFKQVMQSVATLDLPKTCVFLGFDDFSPVEKEFLDSLRHAGVTVAMEDISMAAVAGTVKLPDCEQELISAARWAAARLARNPDKSIAVVIPELATLRPQVERVFTEVFEPQRILPGTSRQAFPFNISAAQPLAQVPMVAIALECLNLDTRLPVSKIVRILQCPFIGNHQTGVFQVEFSDLLLQKYLDLSLSGFISELAHYNKKVNDPEAVSFLDRLQKYSTAVTQQNARQNYLAWANDFSRQLELLGWPGDRELDSLEYQQLVQWHELLNDLASLDTIVTPVDRNQALQRLKQMAYRPFQPQTCSSPIQVLGMLEAAGMHFDDLWVTGMSDDTWPEPCQPNPLLPSSLQRELRMPRASWDRELEIAQKLTTRFCRSAKHVIFSFPERLADQPMRLSALLRDLPIFPPESLDRLDLPRFETMPTPVLESIQDDCARSLAPHERRVKGGTQIIKDQSACPFRAFAKHRLLARRPELQSLGVTPLERGILLHGALQLIWSELKSQEALKALLPDAVETLIEQTLHQAWHRDFKAARIKEQFREIEIQRSKRILGDWLTLEKNRGAFNVLGHEDQFELKVGPLTINLRIDRIDGLPTEDSVAVIDYKTGGVSIKSWSGERLEEPQVPLYALALKDRVNITAFAQLTASSVNMVGLAKEAGHHPDLDLAEKLGWPDPPGNWQTLLSGWEKILADLATEFANGWAVVDPVNPRTTCRYCDLQGLCRINSLSDELVNDED